MMNYLTVGSTQLFLSGEALEIPAILPRNHSSLPIIRK